MRRFWKRFVFSSALLFAGIILASRTIGQLLSLFDDKVLRVIQNIAIMIVLCSMVFWSLCWVVFGMRISTWLVKYLFMRRIIRSHRHSKLPQFKDENGGKLSLLDKDDCGDPPAGT